MSGKKLEITSEDNEDLEPLLEAFENGEFNKIISVTKIGIVQGGSSLFGMGTKSVLKIEVELENELDDETIENLTAAMKLITDISSRIITTLK